jgi:O-antigen/teichoic acid export membrane protein
VSSYFNFKADTYLLQALVLNSAYPLGLYSIAVRMAEVIFYVPDSLAPIFLQRVASSTVEDADRTLGRVGRLSSLLTILLALALVPMAFVGVHVVLPLYEPCLPAFYVLLPGTVSLSLAKVMSSYLAGRGRPELISAATMFALVLNVSFNLVLIPRYGIVGASLASLASYSVYATTTLLIASRLSRQSPLSLFVPGRAEFWLIVTWIGELASRARARSGVRRGAGGLP